MSARDSFDVVVIGGGHNGLVAATVLARSGKSVCVCEARDVFGGVAAGEEFHPGFETTGLLFDSSTVRDEIVLELGLDKYGVELTDHAPPVYVPQANGPGLLLHDDPGDAYLQLSVHSEADARAYRAFREQLAKLRDFVSQLLDSPPPDPDTETVSGLFGLLKSGLAARLLGGDALIELTRIAPMCVADWLGESFENELLKCALAAPALEGTWCAPWSPGTAALLLAYESTRGRSVRGGPAALVRGLHKAAAAHGAELRSRARVERVLVERGVVRGVELQTGATLRTNAVVCACDPKHALLDLVPPTELDADLERDIANFRTRGTTASMNLALDGPLRFVGRPGEVFERVRTGETLDDIERAFDSIKYRRFSERPHLDILMPSVTRPELAPPGKHVAQILVHYAPHEHEKGWGAPQRNALAKAVLDHLTLYAPDVRDQIVAQEVLTPKDIAQRYGLTGGHVHQGEHALDQLLFMRPTRQTAHYTTPIAGLSLAGSGSHPGGGITCVPGYLGARAIL